MAPKTKTTTTANETTKFLKPGKVVIVLQGRYAGRKAVIVKHFEENTVTSRKYSHCILAGIDKYPRKVTTRMSKSKIQKKSHIRPFIKRVNYSHIMPTRYGVEMDLKNIVSDDCVDEKSKKEDARRKVKEVFEERYITGKNKWFFTKLAF
jgi:large subunit ribosomal protein L27e